MKNIVLILFTLVAIGANAQTEPKNNWTAEQKAAVKEILLTGIKSINSTETVVVIDKSKEEGICTCGLNIMLTAYPNTKDYEIAVADEKITLQMGRTCFKPIVQANKAAADKFTKDLQDDKSTFVNTCLQDLETTFTPKGSSDYCACMYQKLATGTISFEAYVLYGAGLDTSMLSLARECVDENELLAMDAPVESEGITIRTEEYDEETLYNSVVDNKENFVTSCTDGLKEDWGKPAAKEYCECMFAKVKNKQITATQLIKISNGEDADAGTLKAATDCIPAKIMKGKN